MILMIMITTGWANTTTAEILFREGEEGFLMSRQMQELGVIQQRVQDGSTVISETVLTVMKVRKHFLSKTTSQVRINKQALLLLG